jgi:hypothetical protein
MRPDRGCRKHRAAGCPTVQSRTPRQVGSWLLVRPTAGHLALPALPCANPDDWSSPPGHVGQVPRQPAGATVAIAGDALGRRSPSPRCRGRCSA